MAQEDPDLARGAPPLGPAPEAAARGPRFTVRLATEGDRGLIVEFLREMIPKEDPERRYDWLYVGNPAGRALTWIASDGAGQAAGVTSFFPWRLWLGGQEVRGALGGDAWVRPAFRRRGIGKLLHGASRAAMREHRIRCMYGAPGPMNVTPLLQGGSRRLTDSVRWARPTGARAFGLGGAGGVGGLLDTIAREVLRPRLRLGRLVPLGDGDGRVDEVWAATREELRLAAIRDERFYSWRFCRTPSDKQRPYLIIDGGRPVAVCALERLSGSLRIVDLCAPRRAWGTALRTICAEAGPSPLVDIRLLAPDAAARMLWRYGFVLRDAKPFLVMAPEGDDDSPLLDGRRWFFTGADSDLDILD